MENETEARDELRIEADAELEITQAEIEAEDAERIARDRY